MLGSILPLACNAGILLAFIIGHFFDYETVAQILLGVPILFIMLISSFPETPSYLLSVDRIQVKIKQDGFASINSTIMHRMLKNRWNFIEI